MTEEHFSMDSLGAEHIGHTIDLILHQQCPISGIRKVQCVYDGTDTGAFLGVAGWNFPLDSASALTDNSPTAANNTHTAAGQSEEKA